MDTRRHLKVLRIHAAPILREIDLKRGPYDKLREWEWKSSGVIRDCIDRLAFRARRLEFREDMVLEEIPMTGMVKLMTGNVTRGN